LTLRFTLAYTTLVLLVVAVAVPAFGATQDVSLLQEEIDQIVKQAEADMQNVLNRFTVDALEATTVQELDDLRSQADLDIDRIRDAAIAELESYLVDHPELEDDVRAAQARIGESAVAAHDEIAYITDQIAPTLPDDTTTTSTTSRTTTTSTTGTTTTTAPETTTTTTFVPAVVPTPPAGTDEKPDTDTDYPLTPPPVFDTASGSSMSISEAMRSEVATVTGALLDGMSVIMPPSVATAVLSLPIAIEIIIGTLFDSVQSLVLPILLLLAAAGILMWRDTRPTDHMTGPTG